jgi:cyanophycinase
MRRIFFFCFAAIINIFFIMSNEFISWGKDENINMNGKLLIVGGALSPSNREVYGKFIEMAGGRQKALIGIIPAASKFPIEAAEDFKNNLVDLYGLEENKIKILPIYDFGYDENTLLDKYQAAVQFLKAVNINLDDFSGIWLTGGDQRKIAQFLYYSNGEETQLLRAIKRIYKKGAVIAGTSAGAAIMSEYMITGGSNKGLNLPNEVKYYWKMDKKDADTLSIGKGLGVFKEGIIDQHFGERDRLYRLIAACSGIKDISYGFGIDENTAVLVTQPDNVIEILGEGGLTVVDMSRSSTAGDINQKEIKGIRLHYLLSGDKYHLQNHFSDFYGKNVRNLSKPLTSAHENLLPNNSFETFIWFVNSQYIKGCSPAVSTYSSANADGEKMFYKFTADTDSNIFYNENTQRFSAENISLNITITYN